MIISPIIRDVIKSVVRPITGSTSIQSNSLFSELIDGIPVSMIKRVRTKDAVEEYCMDLALDNSPGLNGTEGIDYENIYGVEV